MINIMEMCKTTVQGLDWVNWKWTTDSREQSRRISYWKMDKNNICSCWSLLNIRDVGLHTDQGNRDKLQYVIENNSYKGGKIAF